MQLTNKKIFWFSFGISLAAFLTLECWVNSIDYHLTDCIIAICTFTMTFICLEYFKADGKIHLLAPSQPPNHKSGGDSCARLDTIFRGNHERDRYA